MLKGFLGVSFNEMEEPVVRFVTFQIQVWRDIVIETRFERILYRDSSGRSGGTKGWLFDQEFSKGV